MARRSGFLVRAWKAFCYTLGSLVALVVALQLWFFGHIVYWNFANPASTAFMERHREKAGARLQHVWVPYARISPHLKRAVVAAEDAKFLMHEGFDWEAIHKAMLKNEQRGRVVAGASTITQQLAKNLWLSPSRNPLRKVKEAILTWQLERRLSKTRILELYLNVVEFGPGVWGAEAAARRYFGRPAAELDEDQAARLAAALPSPTTWYPGSGSPAYRRHVESVRRRMDRADFLRRQIG